MIIIANRGNTSEPSAELENTPVVMQTGGYVTPKKKVLFYNNWHNGDVHMSRSYVLDLMNLLGDCDYYFHHKNDQKLLADITSLRTVPEMIDADVRINTWIGQYHFQGMSILEKAQNKSVFLGCNFPHYYAVMSQVYDELGLGQEIKSIEYYIPDIAFEKFDIKNIDVFFSTRHQPSVLICNNVVMSGQAPAVDFDTIVVRLADRFPQINFILTNSEVRRIAKNNVFYCVDIINSLVKINDLNEVSYISTYCKIIVGRSSGPYSFSITRKNIKSKKFFCICYFKKNAWTLGSQIDVKWTNESTADTLLSMLSELVNECIN